MKQDTYVSLPSTLETFARLALPSIQTKKCFIPLDHRLWIRSDGQVFNLIMAIHSHTEQQRLYA